MFIYLIVLLFFLQDYSNLEDMQEQHRIEHDLLKKKQLVELNILKEVLQISTLEEKHKNELADLLEKQKKETRMEEKIQVSSWASTFCIMFMSSVDP